VTPYPPIERWLIPQAACDLTQDSVRPAGRRGTESGVFWLGTRAATSAVSVVAKPAGSGVIEEPWRWSVSAELYAAVAAYAKPLGLALLAVVHTHLSTRPPRMSRTDRTRGLQVPDALAVIIGSAGAEREPARWGWFAYGVCCYRGIAAEERAERITLTMEPAEFIEITTGAAAS
jgi:hypothetical protein